jgi:hypothetical protein
MRGQAASSEGFGRQPAFEPPCFRRRFSRAPLQRVAAAARTANRLLTAEDGRADSLVHASLRVAGTHEHGLRRQPIEEVSCPRL